jgi:hypothetical protein
MADDQWTRFNVRSEWCDRTAGGSTAYASWVQNPQWRLRVPPSSKPARVFITVSAGEVPQVKPLASDGRAEAEAGGVVLSYTNAIGLDIFRGYRADDRRRQRMDAGRNGDALVFRAEPQFRRKIVAEVVLEVRRRGRRRAGAREGRGRAGMQRVAPWPEAARVASPRAARRGEGRGRFAHPCRRRLRAPCAPSSARRLPSRTCVAACGGGVHPAPLPRHARPRVGLLAGRPLGRQGRRRQARL